MGKSQSEDSPKEGNRESPPKFALMDRVRLKEDITYWHMGSQQCAAKKGQEGSVFQVSQGTGAILFKFDPVGDMLTNHYFWLSPDKIEVV